jgi:hypothetical protein
LRLRDVSPGYVAEELLFRADKGGAWTLYVGGDVAAPSYDTLPLTREPPKLAASWGTTTPNPTFGNLVKPSTPETPHRAPPLILIVLLVAAAVGALSWLRRRR